MMDGLKKNIYILLIVLSLIIFDTGQKRCSRKLPLSKHNYLLTSSHFPSPPLATYTLPSPLLSPLSIFISHLLLSLLPSYILFATSGKERKRNPGRVPGRNSVIRMISSLIWWSFHLGITYYNDQNEEVRGRERERRRKEEEGEYRKDMNTVST